MLIRKKEEDENSAKYVRINSNTKFEYEFSSDFKVKIVGQNEWFFRCIEKCKVLGLVEKFPKCDL